MDEKELDDLAAVYYVNDFGLGNIFNCTPDDICEAFKAGYRKAMEDIRNDTN